MYSQTMAARFDCKKLLRFALATLCLLALAMFMPVAANAADATAGENETAEWNADAGEKTYATFKRKGSATKDVETAVGKAKLAVHVLQKDGTTFLDIPRGEDFLYQYNSGKDKDLAAKLVEGYAGNLSIPHAFNDLAENEGGYGSVDLLVTAAEGYKIYQVDYTVCYSSKGPEKTGWRADKDATTATSENVPTQFYYLDNITDGTTVDVYLMPAYTVKYQLMYGKNVVVDPSEYSKYIDNDAGLFDSKVAYPKSKEEATANAKACAILEDVSKDGLAKDGNLYGYHRWCDHKNELNAVNFAVSKFKDHYDVVSSVTVPTMTAKEGYNVSGWTVGENKTVKFGDTVKMRELTQYADENRVITLTAVVDKAPSTDSGIGGTTGGNGGNTDSGSGTGGTTGGDNGNTGSGDNDNNGGQESTTTPAPETTPTSTSSVTTVTAVAPTATPTATPAPTAEPTATPAPAAVSAHIPQTSDDMPYTLLVVTALASLCAAGALFMKRRSK